MLYFFLSVFVVTDLAHLIISLSGSHLKQGVLDSGYLDFIAKMDDKVPSNFREERLSVLFFLTTLKSLLQVLHCYVVIIKLFQPTWADIYNVLLMS